MTPPPVPVIVSRKLPLRVFREVATVSADDEVAGLGANEALVLFGSPLALSLTDPLKLPTRVMVTA